MSEQISTQTAQATTPAVEGNPVPGQQAADKFYNNSGTPPEPKQPVAPTEPAQQPKESAPKPVENAPKETPPQKVVPEKYDLKRKEDSLLDASAVERISSYAREKGLSNDEAQELFDRENESVSHYHRKQEEVLSDLSKNVWPKQIQEDPEVGGENFKQSVFYAQKAMKTFGEQDFKDLLNQTGLGNHPGLFKLLYKVGKAMASDNIVHSGDQTGRTKTVEELFYGKNN